MKRLILLILPLSLSLFIYIRRPDLVPPGIGHKAPPIEMKFHQEDQEVLVEFENTAPHPLFHTIIELVDGEGKTLLIKDVSEINTEEKVVLKITAKDLSEGPYHLNLKTAAFKRVRWNLNGLDSDTFKNARSSSLPADSVVKTTFIASSTEASSSETQEASTEAPASSSSINTP